MYVSDLREPDEVDRFNVMLGDFASDGVPYLYVYSTTSCIDNQSCEIYGWSDNKAKLVLDTHRGRSSIAWETYKFNEDENDQCKIKMICQSGWGIGEGFIYYSFDKGLISGG